MLIAWIALLTGAAGFASGQWRSTLLATATVLWVVAVLAFAALLGWESRDVGRFDFVCEGPGHESSYVESEWSWMPPGRVCKFDSGDEGPTWWRVPALAALIALPVASALIRRKGSRQDELSRN